MITDSDSLPSDEVPSSHNSTGAIGEDDTEGDSPTIKWATKISLMQ